MTFIKKKLLIILFVTIGYSCSESKMEDEDELEYYTFKKIEYFTHENSIELFSTELPTFTYSNNSSLEQKWVYNPLINQFDKSIFISDDEKAFIIKDFDVAVPLYIDDDQVYLDSRPWKYSDIMEQQEPLLKLSKEFFIPSDKKITVYGEVFYRKYSLNYELHLENRHTQIVKIIKGHWIGIYVDSANITNN